MTGASAILHALESAGITHLFVNLGSDHPAFLSAFASKVHQKLKIFTSPNEMNALSAASGFAQVTGKPAAVLVHVECGTQGLAGAIHNVSKGRIPVMILAGTVPVTMEGELMGSRNEYIHWIQDVPDQRAIVRQYMRYEHEIRRPHNAIQIVLRAVQFAMSSPQGPTYLVASREALEETIILSAALLEAERPLIVTSYCGRSPEGFQALKALAELLAIPVHENAPIYNNFPTTSFLHQGHQWNGGGQLPALAEADVVLVIDSDVPWIGAQSNPSTTARIFHLDNDPLKESTQTTLWSLPCEKRWKVDSAVALGQLSDAIKNDVSFKSDKVYAIISSRTSHLQERFEKRRERLVSLEATPAEGKMTVPFFMARFREATHGLRVVGLNESTTNLGNVADHLHHEQPLSLIGSGGGALGWYSGAAIGASLALKERDKDGAERLITAFTGDGVWLFGVPSCAYWMAKKYETPFLTIIWNNGGWASPKNACLRIHPEVSTLVQQENSSGSKEKKLSDLFGVSITPSPSFGKIAEGAGDTWWTQVRESKEVDGAIEQALKSVREERRSALIEVVLDTI
ncbi:acetolactate synthase [Thozetella sp. PMI_491]|nr:acetolactate synthase [Thozetella sp. PMI_491]